MLAAIDLHRFITRNVSAPGLRHKVQQRDKFEDVLHFAILGGSIGMSGSMMGDIGAITR